MTLKVETLSGKFETLQNHKPVNTPNTPSTRETTGMEPNTCSPRLNWSPSPVNKIKPFTQSESFRVIARKM